MTTVQYPHRRDGHMGAGTIGVVTGELSRYADFTAALTILGKPDGTRLIMTKSLNVVTNCNQICRKYQGDWVWIIGDDHVFDPDILLRLLSHDVDVVVPLCLKRVPPFDPVVYEGQTADGHYYCSPDLPENELTEIFAAGSAGMLIRAHVLDHVADPWFEGPAEDLNFCAKVRDAGFRIWCDTGTLLGHMHPYTIWPAYRDGSWHANAVLAPNVVLPLQRVLREPVAA